MSAPAKAAKATKPSVRIEAREASIWGVVTDPEALIANAPTRDGFYVPGYSDKRAAWDAAKLAWERGGRHGPPPAPLDFRLQFVSVERGSGQPTGHKVAEFANQGYRKLKWDEAKSFGLDLANTQCMTDAEGNIRNGSQLLMIADRETAARNAARLDATAQGQEAAIADRLADAAAAYNRARGHSADAGTAFGPFTLEPDASDA
jgi:hypothetical protein